MVRRLNAVNNKTIKKVTYCTPTYATVVVAAAVAKKRIGTNANLDLCSNT